VKEIKKLEAIACVQSPHLQRSKCYGMEKFKCWPARLAQNVLDAHIHLDVYSGLGLPLGWLLSHETEHPGKYAIVAWEGDSREVLQSFPEDVRHNFGFELWQLQQGERPSGYSPLPSIGPGVFELRDQDERRRYRVVYLSRVNDVVYVLHCFEKKSREMPRRDFEKAKQRLKAVRARLAEEKKHEKGR
jgi:phage-related protein